MADIERKLYSDGEAIEAICTDQDSDNDNFDCGSDVEYCPDSEDVSANEKNDMEDDSFVLPLQTLARMLKLFQITEKVIVLPIELCIKSCFLYLASQKIYRQTSHRF